MRILWLWQVGCVCERLGTNVCDRACFGHVHILGILVMCVGHYYVWWDAWIETTLPLSPQSHSQIIQTRYQLETLKKGNLSILDYFQKAKDISHMMMISSPSLVSLLFTLKSFFIFLLIFSLTMIPLSLPLLLYWNQFNSYVAVCGDRDKVVSIAWNQVWWSLAIYLSAAEVVELWFMWLLVLEKKMIEDYNE